MKIRDNKLIFEVDKEEFELEIDLTPYSKAYSIFANKTVAFTAPNKKGEARITINDSFYGIDYADVTLTFVNCTLKSVTVTPIISAMKEIDDNYTIHDIKSKCESILSTEFKKVSDMYSITVFEAGDLIINSVLTGHVDEDKYYLITSKDNKEYW